MKNRILWSEYELDIVKKYYPIGGVRACLNFINRSKQTIRKKAREFKIQMDGHSKFFMNYDEERLKKIIKNSHSYSDIAREMNFARASAFNVVKRFAKKYNIDLSHLKNNKEYLKDLHNKQLIPLSEILIENSSYSRTCLKKRLYENGLKKRNCEKCGQGEIWNGEKISLILDHINGIRDDNRITNLRIVCPNCNATLETHCGKHLKNNHRCCSCGGKVSKNSKNCMECYKIILRDGIKKNTFYHKKIEKIDFKIQQYINKVGNAIKENDIDFSKLGWVQKVSELTGILPQKVSYFLKKHFQSFYEKHCYKRQYTGNIMKNYHLQIEQNKDERQNEINKRIQIILNSNIDFNKRGCITNLSKILKIHKGNCLKWIKRNMPELYSNLQINNIIKH